MENQNNNKNGYLGLVIVIGIAILVAVFCTPFVAHAETTNDILKFSPLHSYEVEYKTTPSDCDSNIGKLCLQASDDYSYGWGYNSSLQKPFRLFHVSGNESFYLMVYTGTEKNYCIYNYMPSSDVSGGYRGLSIATNGYGYDKIIEGVRYRFEAIKPDGYTFNTPYQIVGNFNTTQQGVIDLVQSLVNGDVNVYDENAKGSETNPEYDEEIGTLQLKNVAFVKSKFLNLPSWLEGAVIPQVMANFFSGEYLVEWKNTTSTGLSLNYYEEKYGKLQYEYFLECRCSYLNIGGSVGEQFPSYGNRSPIRYEQGSVKHISLKASDILDSIEGVKEDWSKCLYDKKEFQLKFRLYIRPKFTQSLTVIPDSSANAKWVCGRWCAVDLKFRDIVLGNDAHAETGEFNENDVWVTDDDTGTDINAGMINADSVDDALDKLHSYEDVDISDYIKNLNAFSEEVKLIPIIIAKLLSFLPAWVPILIGILIGTCCVVGILRILRG